MQVFKTFLKVTKKYLPSMMIYFAIYAVILVILGNIGEKTDTFSQKSYDICIENKDDSDLTGYLINYISDIHNVKSENYSEDDIKDMIYYEMIVGYIAIPDGFGDSILNGENKDISVMYDDAIPYGMYIEKQIEAYLNSLTAYMEAGYDLANADELTRESLDTEKYIKMTEKESGYSKIYQVYLCMPFVLMYTIFVGVLPVVSSFNKKEIKARTTISALPETRKNLFVIIGALVVSGIIWLALVGVSAGIVKNELISEKGALFILDSFLFLMVTVCMMSVASNFEIKGNTASMISNIIALSFSFLGGIFVPLELLGDGVVAIGKFLPTYWYSTSMELIDKGGSLADIFERMGVMVLFGIMCLAVSLVCGKKLKQRSAS